MDRKVGNSIIKTPLLWIGIIFLLFLNIFSYHNEQQVEKEAQKKIDMMIKNISINNINIFKNILSNYIQELTRIKGMSKFETFEIKENIQYLKEKDNLFNNIEFINYPINSSQNYVFKAILEDSLSFLQIITPISSKKTNNNAISLKIPLNDLHKKIAENKNLSYAYLTFKYKNQYIYHPDEQKLGSSAQELNDHTEENAITESFSDYLNMPVFSYSEIMEINGEQWIITANVPYISFNELVSNIRNSFLLMAISVSSALTLILFLGILFWRKEFLKKQEIKHEKVELELKNELQKQQVLANEMELLKSGLNPHFLFNSLSSLKILVNNRPEEAKKFAVALSNLYKYLLRQQGYSLTTLEDELKFTKDYIYLQQIRFNQKIKVSININEKNLKQELPPLSLQLLIENCIKHTKMSEKEPLEIEINTTSDYLIVKNNYNPPINTLSSGIGLENLTKRYKYLTSSPCIFTIKNNYYIAQIPLLS